MQKNTNTETTSGPSLLDAMTAPKTGDDAAVAGALQAMGKPKKAGTKPKADKAPAKPKADKPAEGADSAPPVLHGEILPPNLPADKAPVVDLTLTPRKLKLKAGAIEQVDPRHIGRDDAENVRNDTDDLAEHIDGIAASIAENGFDQTQPIAVYEREPGIFFVSHGFCRHRAALSALQKGYPIKTVPVIVEVKAANDADRMFGHFSRNTGKALAPIEQAEVFKRLLKMGWEEGEIARRAAKSITHVKNMLTLSAAPSDVQEAVKDGQVSATEAVRVLKTEGTHVGAETIRTAINAAVNSGRSRATGRNTAAARTAPRVNGQSAPAPHSPLGTTDPRVILERLMHHVNKACEEAKAAGVKGVPALSSARTIVEGAMFVGFKLKP